MKRRLIASYQHLAVRTERSAALSRFKQLVAERKRMIDEGGRGEEIVQKMQSNRRPKALGGRNQPEATDAKH